MELKETKPIEYFKLGPPAGAFGKLGFGCCAKKSQLQIRNEVSTEGSSSTDDGKFKLVVKVETCVCRSAAAPPSRPALPEVRQASAAITMRSACMCVGAVWKRFDAPYTESAGTDWHRVKT